MESSTTSQSFDDFWPIAAAVSLSTMPYLMFIGLPIILGTIADKFVLSDEQIGWIASADLSGLFLGSIVTSLLIRRVPLRRLALIGVAIGLIGNGLSSSADDLIQFCIIRFIADFGSGRMSCTGFSVPFAI